MRKPTYEKLRKALVMTAPVALAIAVTACGAPRTPPVELQNARAEVVRAKSGPAARNNPTQIHEAEQALQSAEHAWNHEPDAPETLDLATIAYLRALTAQSEASTMDFNAMKATSAREVQAAQAQRIQSAEGALSVTQGALSKTREQLEREQQVAHGERAKRVEAETKLKEAMTTLSKIAQVKEEDRGTVITFPGEVLFKTNEATLKPAAMAKLDQVVESLRGQERKVLVLGHTDNQGAAAYNMDLSNRRASAVRDYITSKGIPQDLVRAEGKGLTTPVSDNTSVDGRAANRRVEIVVEPSAKSHP